MAEAAPHAWVIGAGLAGLSAAIRLVQQGRPVSVLEAAGQAGGRCRSYYDKHLDRRIDNGNHLLLSGNRSALSFLKTVSAGGSLIEVAPARLPFVDLGTGDSWTLKPNAGPIPWWVLAKGRRVPQTRPSDYLSAARMARAGDRTVEALFASRAGSAKRQLYDRFWEPMAIAVLNTEASAGAAGLLWPVMTEILFRGEAVFRPCIAREGLSESFIEPALHWLAERNVEVRFNARVREIDRQDNTITALKTGSDTVRLTQDDRVVMAVPPGVSAALLPEVPVPIDYRPIVNLHFLLKTPVTLPGDLPLLGLIGGTAQWLFLRDNILSVTISAAIDEAEMTHEDVAAAVWDDICRALSLTMPIPSYRVVTEKRATIAQTPAQERLRPATRTPFRNLFLAGDWTDTGLPCTIEGAVRSGETAAAAAIGKSNRQMSSS